MKLKNIKEKNILKNVLKNLILSKNRNYFKKIKNKIEN